VASRWWLVSPGPAVVSTVGFPSEGNGMPEPQPATPEMLAREGRWLSTAEAAAYLGITPRTVYRLIDTGQLPAYRIGRVIRLTGHDLDAFIDSARIQPGTLRHLYDPDADDNDDDGPDGLFDAGGQAPPE
jgi:excisionase family DNA binding protein